MTKKFFIVSGLFCSLIFSGCEKKLEEKYINPEKSATPNIPALLTGIMDNDRVRPSYWNVRTFLLPQPAVYSQLVYFPNSTTRYQQNDSYSGQYWSNFYVANGNGSGVLGMYRAMEVAYAALSEEDKKTQEIYMQAARVLLYDQGSQMVDMWGDIPFSKAGSLESTGSISDPTFDQQAELYNLFLTGLKEAAAYFSKASGDAGFTKADILLSGNIDKWERYANSLRLRLLMRISNPQVSEAIVKTDVLEILSKSNDYPLIDGGNVGNYSPLSADVLLRPLTNYTSNLNGALTEVPSYYAPDYLLNTAMKPVDDPRIPVMFDKFGATQDKKFIPNKEYNAMPVGLSADQQSNTFQNYSILDSTTFLQNKSLPGIVITASEVNFLKAEAYQRWGEEAKAKEAYETAVAQSITFYYFLNNSNLESSKRVPMPSGSIVNTFISKPEIAYNGDATSKLAKIWTQKWIHFGFLQSIQAWSEYRRTDYPNLTFPSEGTLSGCATPPNRLIYPSVETSYNTHYKDVQAKDKRDTAIFWDK